MKKTKDTPRSGKELLDELQALVAEAETIMAGSASEHTAEALANLRARFNAAKDQFSHFYETAKEHVVTGAKCTDTAIRENPYQSIAVAVGVGVLVGVLVGRRSA